METKSVINAVVLILSCVNTFLEVNTNQTQTLKCKDYNTIWGDVDPNIFYICDRNTNKAIEMHCLEGRGFFNGFGYFGCIPYEEWPACIVFKNVMQKCDYDHLMKPSQNTNPNKFYMCLEETSPPIELFCEHGKGFVNINIVDLSAGDHKETNSSNIMGCTNWEKWRSYMQCENYI